MLEVTLGEAGLLNIYFMTFAYLKKKQFPLLLFIMLHMVIQSRVSRLRENSYILLLKWNLLNSAGKLR